MLVEQILKYAPLVLTESERLSFFETGYLALNKYVPDRWLSRLQAAMHALIERSRDLTESDDAFLLDEGHSVGEPRLHRITSPQDIDDTFWEFLQDPAIVDLAADVLGPDVKFHHCKLNIKSAKSSKGFGWHQDILGWPHTDFSPVTMGIYLDPCEDPEQGPLAFIPGSHLGPLNSIYDAEGNFPRNASEDEVAWAKDIIEAPLLGAGSVVLVNCRVLHGSAANLTNKRRSLLLPVFSSADSFPYTVSPVQSRHQGEIVRGEPARIASFDTRPCEVPPDWSRKSYRTAFKAGAYV